MLFFSTNHYLKVVLCCLVLFVTSVTFASCGGGSGSISDSAKEYVADTEIAQVFADPDAFKGKYIRLSGRVFNDVEKKGSTFYFQMWADSEMNKNTIVSYNGEIDGLTSDVYVIVDGLIAGTFHGENAFGAKLTAPQITADSLQVVSYMEAFAPAIKTIVPENNAINQGGYIVTIDKIEFAQQETRVHMTVQNSGSAAFNLYSFNSLLLQNGKQYETDSKYDADYPEIQTGLLSGNTTQGIMVFPSVPMSDFQLRFEASSEDWDEDLQDYVFDVVVE